MVSFLVRHAQCHILLRLYQTKSQIYNTQTSCASPRMMLSGTELKKQHFSMFCVSAYQQHRCTWARNHTCLFMVYLLTTPSVLLSAFCSAYFNNIIDVISS